LQDLAGSIAQALPPSNDYPRGYSAVTPSQPDAGIAIACAQDIPSSGPTFGVPQADGTGGLRISGPRRNGPEVPGTGQSHVGMAV